MLTVQKRNGLLLWRGDMLPDQLAPGETGTLIRKHQEPDGTWKTTRTHENYALAAHTNFITVARSTLNLTLPGMIIETPYQLGTLDDAPVLLVLWRTAEEESPPLGGFIALQGPPPPVLAALRTNLPPFAAQAEWTSLFNALAP